MAKNNNLKDFLTDVASAIRAKKGTLSAINPQDFSSEIRNIWADGSVVNNQEKSIEVAAGNHVDIIPDFGYTGLGMVSIDAKVNTPKDVNFYDYDGTLLYAYSVEEFLIYNALPPLPQREGLICQEWNYTLDEVVDCCNRCGACIIGATYITDDGKTRIYVDIPSMLQSELTLGLQTSTAEDVVVVNWGDGSPEETISNTIGDVLMPHKYTSIGEFCITIEVVASAKTILLGSHQYDSIFYEYSNCQIVKAELGSDISLNKRAFRYSPIEYINFPSGILMEDEAFYKALLKSLILPRGFTTINRAAFTGNKLKVISFPMSLNTFVFYNNGTSSGTSISGNVDTLIIPNPQCKLPKNLPSCKKLIIASNSFNVGGAVQLNTSAEELVLANNMTHFDGIKGTNLRKVKFSANLVSIGPNASGTGDESFDSALIPRIDYPKTLMSIKGNYKFSVTNPNIKRIHNFTNHEAVPSRTGGPDYSPIKNYSFNHSIVVPDSLFYEWIQTDGWTAPTCITTDVVPEECISLSISAYDVPAESKRTTIIIDAIVNGKSITSGEYKESAIYRTGEYSESFEANTSTDPITREVSFTLLGVTATTTFTQAGVVETTTE